MWRTRGLVNHSTSGQRLAVPATWCRSFTGHCRHTAEDNCLAQVQSSLTHDTKRPFSGNQLAPGGRRQGLATHAWPLAGLLHDLNMRKTELLLARPEHKQPTRGDLSRGSATAKFHAVQIQGAGKHTTNNGRRLQGQATPKSANFHWELQVIS